MIIKKGIINLYEIYHFKVTITTKKCKQNRNKIIIIDYKRQIIII